MLSTSLDRIEGGLHLWPMRQHDLVSHLVHQCLSMPWIWVPLTHLTWRRQIFSKSECLSVRWWYMCHGWVESNFDTHSSIIIATTNGWPCLNGDHGMSHNTGCGACWLILNEMKCTRNMTDLNHRFESSLHVINNCALPIEALAAIVL